MVVIKIDVCLVTLKHDLELFAKNRHWLVRHAVDYMVGHHFLERLTGTIGTVIAPRNIAGLLQWVTLGLSS